MADQETALVLEILSELARARSKFPGDNVTTLAMVEEAGELATAVFEEPRANVRKEAVQTAVMAMRIVLDGDATLRLWRALKGLDQLTDAPMDGATLIAIERQRQQSGEGWTPEHDDSHCSGDLSRAAACYALESTLDNHHRADGLPATWPWSADWWKPKDRLTDLVRAGALIAAEIDRLQRETPND